MDINRDDLEHEYESGMSLEYMAVKRGVTISNIVRVLLGSIEQPKHCKKAYENAAFSNEQVKEIRERVCNGEATRKEIADQYNVSMSSVLALLRHETYQHAGGPRVKAALVTEKDVIESIRLKNCGFTWIEVGQRMGFSPSALKRAVYKYVNKKPGERLKSLLDKERNE